VASQMNYVNGVENGAFAMYYNNGELETEGMYLGGRLDGNYTYYYETGKKMYGGEYAAGLKDDLWVYYLSNGKIKMFIKYEDGKTKFEDYKNGEFVDYFDSGMPASISNYKDGKKNGRFVEYYNNGKRELQAREKDDPYQPEEQVEVIVDQQIKKEQFFKDDKLEGELNEFTEDGKLIRSENYKDGVLITVKN